MQTWVLSDLGGIIRFYKIALQKGATALCLVPGSLILPLL